MKNKFLFLDRDGVIIEDKPYQSNFSSATYVNGILDLLKWSVTNQYRCHIVTNQSGIGRGFYDLETFKLFMKELIEDLGKKIPGLVIDYSFCPHHPHEQCKCRKPRTGMVDAILELIDADKSIMIGDRLSDAEFGVSLKLNKIFILDRSKTLNFKEGQKHKLCRNFQEIMMYI